MTIQASEDRLLHLSRRPEMASSVVEVGERRESRDQARAGYQYPLQLTVVFALYFGVGKLGLAVPFTSSNVSPMWPAAGGSSGSSAALRHSNRTRDCLGIGIPVERTSI